MEQTKVLVPPVKCQGIKTRLVPFIREKLQWDDRGVWIEPFVGTGVVVFNLAPKQARLSDKNQYIIALYHGIQSGTVTSQGAREFLELHGARLSRYGADYYREMRSHFNENKDPLYFLFLNRSDFNGMIRFNRKGQFNVPFGHKPERFSKAYITKVCNQIAQVTQVMAGKDWTFTCCPWQQAFEQATAQDLIYLDPPYIGRDTSYVGEWPESEAIELARMAHSTPAQVALSMWKENRFRKNEHLFQYWSDFTWYEQEHFYHIGARETNRHPMTEVLAVKH